MANEDDGLQIECILIDDCSTDNSLALINRLIDGYTGTIDFRVIKHAKNCGPGSSVARNTGIDAARGKYLWFVDADDTIAEHCLTQVIPILEADALDALYIVMNDAEIPFSERSYGSKNYSAVISGEEFLTGGADKIEEGAIWAFIFNKDFWDSYHFRFMEGIYAQDMQVRSYILSKAQKMRYLKEGSLYFYRQIESSISHKKPKKINLYSWAVVGNTYLEHAKETQSEALRAHFYAVATHAFRMGIGILHRLKGEREYVAYFMSHLQGFTPKLLRCYNTKEQFILSSILRHPYTYFKIRNLIYNLTDTAAK
jgi:glycosyltransferase involved in cell wall biosynthesis